MVIADHNVNAGIRLLPALCLHITPCCHDHCLRVHFPGAVEHLAGFAVCDIRHRTGIDDIDIRPFFKGNDLIARLFEHFLHCFCLICVYFTSQVVERCFFSF